MTLLNPTIALDTTIGYSANLSALRNTDTNTVSIHGVDSRGEDWHYTLTRRAAMQLWYDLTRILFPEKSEQVLGQVTTHRSIPTIRLNETRLTQWTFVNLHPEGGCEIQGWVGTPTWRVRLHPAEIYRFWALIDQSLYPNGW